jgi:hypothetical protein
MVLVHCGPEYVSLSTYYLFTLSYVFHLAKSRVTMGPYCRKLEEP